MSDGLLLVHAPAERVARWAERGLVAARVTPLGSWTAVQAAEPTSRAADPYGDAVPALAARPLGPTVRPALGFFNTDGYGLVTVRTRGVRSAHRWLLWAPATGARVLRDLPPVRPTDLVAAVGGRGAAVGREVRSALAVQAPTAGAWLAGIHRALGLPGAGLLAGTSSTPGDVVQPRATSVTAFDNLVAEDRAHRVDLGESS